jgi:hypothetical protein
MELKFTNENFNIHDIEVFETPPKPLLKRNKAMTYDDILNSLNVRIKEDGTGILEFKEPVKKVQFNEQQNQTFPPPQTFYATPPPQTYYANNNFTPPQTYYANNNFTPPQQHTFTQLTPQEYKRKKILDYINYRNEKIRISNIKTTKLQFNNGNNTTIKTFQQPNNLFKFKYNK